MNEMKKETAKRAATSAEAPDDAVEAVKVSRKSRKFSKSRTRTVLMLIVPALLIVGGLYLWLASGGSESTSNPYFSGFLPMIVNARMLGM